MATRKAEGSLPNILLVENDNGEVYIVENKESILRVEQILKECGNIRKIKRDSNSYSPSKSIKIQSIKQEFKFEDEQEVVEEYLDEYLDYSVTTFETTKAEDISKEEIITYENVIEELEISQTAIPDAIMDHQYMIQEQTFNGQYSSDGEGEEKDVKPDMTEKERKTQRHKFRQLTGRTACKYCETVFRSKESLKSHKCKYLECDPKNFICRVCEKELSKKTFSNHLHETLDCQYCNKNFVNPRNLKNHIKKMHNGEKFIPPQKQNFSDTQMEYDESFEPVLDEMTGMLMTENKKKRKIYPKMKRRLECDLCGRIFTTLRSLQIHMDLHTNNHRYVCQTCGERYATHTGIMKHACMNKKRKRPDVDFRIFDVRHCKYCGLSFSTYEENKAHLCDYQFKDDPKLFRCRFCYVDISKSSYNKHVMKHLDSGTEWVCGFCDKKLSDENALNVHLTTHTGDKHYKCTFDDCNQSFINKQLLTRHTRFHGVEIPVYNCRICNKEVASKYHLKTHEKIHDSLVECPLCKLGFEGKEDLKTHYQDFHEPFPCSMCDKVFVLPRYLKMHEKLHNPGDRPHSCLYCVKSFTKVALLMNHVYKVHASKFEEFKLEQPEIFK